MITSLILEFTKRDFVERYTGSILGASWAFIKPLVDILIYTVVFSRIMSAKLNGVDSSYSYSIYLIAGILPWTAFINTLLRTTTSFTDKKNIISKMDVNLIKFPSYILLSEVITYIISLVFYFIFLYFSGYGFSKYIILLPVIFIMQQILAYSMGIFFAILNVFIRDIKEIVSILTQIWFWLTPIVYVENILPGIVKKIMVFNPAYLFIKPYHDIFVFKQLPNLTFIISLSLLAHLFAILTYLAFKYLQKDVRDFI